MPWVVDSCTMRQTSTWLGRTSAAFVVVLLAAFVSATSPAGAMTDDERFTAYDDAAIALTHEVGWLVRLGGLAEPVPSSIAAIPDNIGLPVLSRAEMIERLRGVDSDGPRILNGLLSTGDAQSQAVRDSFHLLPPGTLETLQSGGNPGIPADGYDVAYTRILEVWGPLYDGGATRVSAASPPNDGQASAAATDPTPTFATTDGGTPPAAVAPGGTAAPMAPAAPAASVGDAPTAPNGSLQPRVANPRPIGATATTVAPRAEASTPTIAPVSSIASGAESNGGPAAADVASESGGSSPAPIIGAVVAGVLLLAGLVLAIVRRRRRGVGRSSDTGVTVAVADLFELSRVLPTLRTPEAVAEHAVQVVRGIAGADAAVAVVDEQLLPLAGELQLGASALRPVLEAGTRVRKTIGAQAFIAAPLVTAGRVCGAVVASRTGKGFSVPVEEQLGQVATLMASSLQAAFAHRDAERMAYIDGLTQVANRRRFDLDLSDALRNAQAGARAVSLAMVDIDHFKRLNDTYGHQTGDAVLREVAATIKANVRGDDVVYRYGGEEFAVLLPDADAAQAADVVERVRAAVQTQRILDDRGEVIEVTVSVGVARSLADEPRDLLAAADGALYEAKDGGRNRVVIAER